MDNLNFTLDDTKDTVKEKQHEVKSIIKRESDSLDDFEHLGHDSSPLQEIKQESGDLLGSLNIKEGARDVFGEINKGVEQTAVAGHKLTDDFSSFDPLKSSSNNLFDRPISPKKMDSNVLQMGEGFPDRKEADDKLDKFLQEMTSPFSAPKGQEPPENTDKYNFDSFKTSTKNFMDNEREVIAPEKLHSNNDLMNRYSDSEPENDDDFKPSKYSDIPKKDELPESFESTDNVKRDSFKDIHDLPPELPKRDTHAAPPSAPEQPKPTVLTEKIVDIKQPGEPAKAKKHEPVKPTAPAPEPVKEKTPEPPKKIENVNVKAVTETKKATVTDAEAIFCKMGLDTWFNPERLNPKVESLIYWRDPKKSGPVFGGVLVVLLALTYFSLISVAAYLSLVALSVTIAFRIYKNIVQAVQKTGDGHPFKDILELDLSLPQDKVREVSEIAVAHINAAVVELRRLFLVEDLVDSIKFGVLLWTLTYVGAWFNGMTLVIIAWVALFTLPKVYETNKTQIDANLEIVRTKLAEITSKVKAAVPIGKKAEEKKEQ